jgi:transposase
MAIHYYVGIDISKATLDWAIFDSKTLALQTTTPNTVTGIETALRQLKLLTGWNPEQGVFCMEHTAQAALRHL